MKVETLEKPIENIVIIEKPCIRCPHGIAEPGKSRCLKCLEYARKWQKAQTKERRQLQKCITCGTFTGGPSRCSKCTNNKS